MTREPLRSKAFLSAGYDRDTLILEVEFINGRVYRYFGVPLFLYQGFLLASSKGEYFSRRINNRYPCEEVQSAS